ncbi:UDP-N-acetylglucosamine transferase subunit ALG14 [Pelomyxa schiedti]|nr:UDP-N-acetylglucosamine transferase subunit ALG14 [Pelomyxa schiedti]
MEERTVFVTVGTTNFDPLIRVADSEQFRVLMMKKGYTGVVMQIGNGAYLPSCVCVPPRGLEDSAKAEASSQTGKWRAVFYRFKDSLDADMKNAALVISHAGAGSIVEAVRNERKTFVVINDTLMGNHQTELATKMSSLGAIVLVKRATLLLDTLEQDPGADEPIPNIDPHLGRSEYSFTTLVDQSQTILPPSSRSPRNSPVSTMIVLGSGGHTMEMLQEIAAIDKVKFAPRHYVIATGDVISTTKANKFEGEDGGSVIHHIPRSRRVGQSYFTSIFTTIYSFLFSFYLVMRIRPNLVLCNGPGTCLPIVISAWILRVFLWHSTSVVYIESICRVTSLSLTGRLLFNFVQEFVVQWPETVYCAPTAKCHNFFFRKLQKDS